MDRKPIFLDMNGDAAEIIAEKRHIFCPQYAVCLDEAVLRNRNFICNDCAFKLYNVQVREAK